MDKTSLLSITILLKKSRATVLATYRIVHIDASMGIFIALGLVQQFHSFQQFSAVS